MNMPDEDDDDRTVIRPTTSTARPNESPNEVDDGEHASSLPIGFRLDEFEITQRIGEGGFSIVYLAWDHSLERKVALKEYMPASIAVRMGHTRIDARATRHRGTYDAGLKSFINEAKLLARFDHPALVKVYRFWEANGTAYMVMPFYQGETLKSAVRAMPAPPDEAWIRGLLAPLTQALAVIHGEHCFHRDIAPDNVILLADTGKPLLLDFGAARRVIGDMTQGLTVILKPGYAPVEQYAETPGMKQGPWTDVYALAAVVYWLITTRTPPVSVGRVLNDSYVPLTESAKGRYSASLLRAVDRALEVRPERRTQTIEAFRDELKLGSMEAAPAGSDRDRGRDRDRDRERDTAPKGRSWALAGVASLVIAAGAVGWWAVSDRGGSSPSSASVPLPAPAPNPATSPSIEPGPSPAPSPGGSPSTSINAGGSTGSETTAPALSDTPSHTSSPSPSPAPAPAPAPAPEPSFTTAPAPAPSIAPAAPARESAPARAPARTEPRPEPLNADAPTRPSRQSTNNANNAANNSSNYGSNSSPNSPTAPATPRRETARQPSQPAAGKENAAECARILQRLSLGEDSPGLSDRLRTLGCN